MPAEAGMIPSNEEITGSLLLPLARVKKTIAQDEDIGAVSAQSNFLIAKATEIFIRYLVERAFTAGKAENKVKKSLLYRDIANIIARTDNLEFLSDLVPQTTTWRNHKAKKARDGPASLPKTEPLPLGQTTIDGKRSLPIVPNDASILSQSPSSPDVNGGQPSSSHDLVFQHYEPNGTRKGDYDSDVDMT